jgi:eukaryotic-like serine/threonine-protein kinase
MSSKKRFFIPREDRKLGNRYELLEQLGDGSHGTVWRAARLADNNIVAVKIPREQGAATEHLREGTPLIGREPHPNVVSVYWMDWVPPTRDFFAIEMEYFPSNTLAELLGNGKSGFVSSYSKLLGLFEEVLTGVAYLHALGMCHGDIKPHNILVSGDTAKITDFGSSVWPEDIYARTRENGGTILYSAPELASTLRRGKTMDELFSGDIYSLGVLLYHMVTGDLPHDTPYQVVNHSPFPRPREVNTSVCPAVEEVILRCLAHSPSDRFQSVDDLIVAARRAKQAQIAYIPERIISAPRERAIDWSSDVVEYLEQSDYARAEHVAREEFQQTKNPHAFVIMVNAAMRAERYFDALAMMDTHADVIDQVTSAQSDLHFARLKALLETRQVGLAEKLLTEMIVRYGETPDLLFKKASILGMQASYEDACEILLRLNRDFPGRAAILRRLVIVHEQLRDVQRAAAFLKAYQKVAGEDPWSVETRVRYQLIGVR